MYLNFLNQLTCLRRQNFSSMIDGKRRLYLQLRYGTLFRIDSFAFQQNCEITLHETVTNRACFIWSNIKLLLLPQKATHILQNKTRGKPMRPGKLNLLFLNNLRPNVDQIAELSVQKTLPARHSTTFCCRVRFLSKPMPARRQGPAKNIHTWDVT